MKTKSQKLKEAVQVASNAHSNLNAFATVAIILEGGVVYGTNAAASRIIKIALDEQQRQLKLYDAAIARISKITGIDVTRGDKK